MKPECTANQAITHRHFSLDAIRVPYRTISKQTPLLMFSLK